MLDNIISGIGNIFDALGNLPSLIGNAITGAFNFINEQVSGIANGLSSFFTDVGNFFSDFGNFIINLPSIIWNGITSALHYLFVPSDGYFDNIVFDIKTDISNKIPYGDFINTFEDLAESENYNSNGEISVNLNGYRVSNDLTINVDNFIDFSNINSVKDTWHAWVRGFIWILLIIYNVNEVIKFLNKYSFSAQSSSSNSSGGGNK